MSLSLTGHDDHGHGKGPKKSRLIWVAVGIFLIIWFGNALVYEFTGVHRPNPAYADVKPVPVVKHFIDPLYRSLQLFHFHDSHWDGHVSVLSYISRFLAAAYALGLPLLLVVWIIRGGFLKMVHGFTGKNFTVVVGDNPYAILLAEDLVRNGRQVVFVSPEEIHGHHTGALEVSGDLSSPEFWSRDVRIQKAAAVVLLSEDDSLNIRWSVTIEKVLADSGRTTPLVCHLHLADLHLKKGLMSLLPALGESPLLERRYFSRHEIAARLLSRRYPLPSTLVNADASAEHYVIIGFGQLGENVALKLVKMGQRIIRVTNSDGSIHHDVRNPRVTVIDKLGSKAADAFLRSHPGFTETCDFTIHQLDCRDSRFLNLSFLEGLQPDERCSLIFCLEDETLVVSTILMMLDVCQDPEKDIDGIYLRGLREDGPGDLLQRRQPLLSKNIPITPFAADREIWNEDVVLGLSLDLMAERIHEAYRRGVAKLPAEPGNPAPAANKTWLDLSAEERDGNREPADHMWAKLRTLGYELEMAPIGSTAAPTGLSSAIEEHIEELASSEHYRWMAWRLINGWTYGTPRDNAAKKHPDIVSYEDLTEEGREKDRMIVRIIPQLLETGRLAARKIP